MKPVKRKTRTYTRVTFITPANMADDAAGILVTQGALGCEVTRIPGARLLSRAASSTVYLNAYFNRLSAASLRKITKSLANAGMLVADGQMPLSQPISDPGWATAWMSRFEPLRVGQRFLIVPPWNRGHEDDRIRIVIQPGQAFGTGHHPSTFGVLETIEEICAGCRIARALDVGTGSGILALAMSKLGVRKVVAIDVDPVALENARENAEYNHVERQIRFSVAPLQSIRGKYDLITANILSSTLIALAPLLKSRLAPGGRLILSGILNREAENVRKHYEPDLRHVASRVCGAWTVLVMER